MAKSNTYSDKKIIDALHKAKGIQAEAARILGCVRQTVSARIQSSEEVKKAYQATNESVKDEAENALYNLLTNGDHKDHFKAIQFYLRTKAKDRGYGERDNNDGMEQYIKKLADALQPIPEAKESD